MKGPTLRSAWASNAQSLAYRLRVGAIERDEIGALYAGAIAFLPADDRPVEAVTAMTIASASEPELASSEMIDFILDWLDDASVPAEPHDWQTRADTGHG